MRLYLSSYNVGTHPERLSALVGTNRRTAVVTNAGDLWDDYRSKHLARFFGDLRGARLEPEELDLRRFFKRADDLRTTIASYGLIWVTGGNTFVLRRAMAESGFDRLLPPLIRNDTIVYGGFSAGACVAAPSLEGIHLADEPACVPDNYPPGEIPWTGLGLINFYIAPHYRSNHPESPAIEGVVKYFEDHGLPYEALADGDALVVEYGQITRSR